MPGLFTKIKNFTDKNPDVLPLAELVGGLVARKLSTKLQRKIVLAIQRHPEIKEFFHNAREGRDEINAAAAENRVPSLTVEQNKAVDAVLDVLFKYLG